MNIDIHIILGLWKVWCNTFYRSLILADQFKGVIRFYCIFAVGRLAIGSPLKS